jgi:hypothetical protein
MRTATNSGVLGRNLIPEKCSPVIIARARVSTEGQKVALQLKALKQAGHEQIFVDEDAIVDDEICRLVWLQDSRSITQKLYRTR